MPLNNCQQDFKESIHLLLENQIPLEFTLKSQPRGSLKEMK